MALSFEESKRMAAEMAAKAEPVALQAEAAPMAAVVDMPEAQANDDGGYTRSEKYLWYSQYNDDAFSTIDEMKNVVMDESQINITQETNSQVIPFKMPRRYDGIDLMQMMLQVHYLNVDGQEAYATPINVTYNEDTIRFYWLVTNSVTSNDQFKSFDTLKCLYDIPKLLRESSPSVPILLEILKSSDILKYDLYEVVKRLNFLLGNPKKKNFEEDNLMQYKELLLFVRIIDLIQMINNLLFKTAFFVRFLDYQK